MFGLHEVYKRAPHIKSSGQGGINTHLSFEQKLAYGSLLGK